MKQIVRDADQAAALLRNQRVYRFFSRKESFPGGRGYLFGERAGSVASVESIVTVPQRPPARVVGGFDRSNQNDFKPFAYRSDGCVVTASRLVGSHTTCHPYIPALDGSLRETLHLFATDAD